MKNTVTKAIKSELKEFADKITPPEPAAGAVPGKGLTAQQLRDQYGITSDKSGSPLKDGTVYIAKDLPAVNQHRRLLKAFERGGWAAVEAYLLPYRTPAALARQAAEAAQLHPMAATLQPDLSGEPAIFHALPEASDELRISEPVQAWIDEAGTIEQQQLQQQQLQQLLHLMPLANLGTGRICGAECGAVTCPCEGACS